MLPLPQDMSPRQYYRRPEGGLFMDAAQSGDLQAFYDVACYLRDVCGLRAPIIYGHNLQEGWAILEDFGDLTLTRYLEGPTEENLLGIYKVAIDVLIQLQDKAQTKPLFLEDYTPQKLLEEALRFPEFYWPWKYEKPMNPKALESFKEIWQTLFETMPLIPQTLVLRDYHVDNIMKIDHPFTVQSCGILDFQDALWGPCVYDVVSLLEDARRTLPLDLRQDLWTYYLSFVPQELHAAYEKASCILGIGRHLKVLGVFTRYAIVQNNPSKLCHLPRLWAYIEEKKDEDFLAPFYEWLGRYVDPNNGSAKLMHYWGS